MKPSEKRPRDFVKEVNIRVMEGQAMAAPRYIVGWITVCKACDCIHDGRHTRCPECDNGGDRHVLWQQPVSEADERMYPREFIGPMGDGGIYEAYMPGPRWK